MMARLVDYLLGTIILCLSISSSSGSSSSGSSSSGSSSSASASSSSEDVDDIDITIADINILRDQIREIIDDSINTNLTAFEGDFIDFKPLLATIVDLQWHDCAGPKESNDFGDEDWSGSICDGCIDFDRFDFHGTLPTRAIEPLEIVYNTHYGANNKLWKDKISRADFWATSSTLSLEYGAELQSSPRSPIPSNIPVAILSNIPYYFGRDDCEYSPESDETLFEFPPLNRGFDPSFNWFDLNFEFSKAEFVALMGVHTLGKGRRDSSGFAHFWNFEDEILNNDYYITTKDPITQWKQLFIDNTEEDGPDRFQWVLGNPGFLLNPVAEPFFERALRLNVDMSLYLKIEDDIDLNNDPAGGISCLFKNVISRENECPFQDSEILDVFNIYANATNNQQWMDDFAIVWEKMVTIGYDTDTLKVINL